jgi:hypothetical protein
VLPANKVDKKLAKEIDHLLADALEQAVSNFNSKVVTWNAWAKENGGEILSTR